MGWNGSSDKEDTVSQLKEDELIISFATWITWCPLPRRQLLMVFSCTSSNRGTKAAPSLSSPTCSEENLAHAKWRQLGSKHDHLFLRVSNSPPLHSNIPRYENLSRQLSWEHPSSKTMIHGQRLELTLRLLSSSVSAPPIFQRSSQQLLHHQLTADKPRWCCVPIQRAQRVRELLLGLLRPPEVEIRSSELETGCGNHFTWNKLSYPPLVSRSH